ncbi:hypothetical protein ES703_78008 [subsurface metagenome]
MAIETEKKYKCPPHHWIIDCNDIGRCIYCPEVRDFRKLQRREATLGALRTRGNYEGTSKVTHGRRGRPRKDEEV